MGHDRTPIPPPEPVRPPEPPKSRRNWPLYVAIGVIVVLLLLLAGFFLGWFGGGSEDGQNDQSVATPDQSSMDGEDQSGSNGNMQDGSEKGNKGDNQGNSGSDENGSDKDGPGSKPTKMPSAGCASHSKICFQLPPGWKSKFSHEIDEDYKQKNPSVEGEIHIERLSLFNNKGVKKITLLNRYGSPEFSGGWGKGGSCQGKIKRRVVDYRPVNFTQVDPGFSNNYVVQAVADELDPSKIDPTDLADVEYVANIELAPRHPTANAPGNYDIDCEVLVGRGWMSGLTQPFDEIEINVLLNDKPLTNLDEAENRLRQAENQQAFNIIASIHQK